MTEFSRRSALTVLAAAPLAFGMTGPARAATHNVSIRGFAFVPDALTVAVGDTVVFTNEDGAPHTATANDGSFDTGRLSRDESGSITINTAGRVEYICAFHSSMKGAITAA